MVPRPPLDEVLALFQAIVAAEGITTAPGAAAGNSIEDAGLAGSGVDSFLSMLMVVYPGQPRLVDSMDITAFNNATGEVTFDRAYKGVAAAIPAGIPYKIITFRFVPAEVAELLADVGNASASTLGSLYNILGDPAVDLATLIAAIGAGGVGKPNVQEVIIYPVAEDADVTELADDGTGPAYYPAVAASTNAVGEGAAVAAWTEDINFEQEGTITIISIYAEFEWQSRFLVGAGNGTNTGSKIQISRDGGATWVDLTDNYIHNNAAMTNRIRAGVGRWIPTIVAGANQLQFRLVHWVDVGNGISTSEAQIRSNSYVRLTYRKS